MALRITISACIWLCLGGIAAAGPIGDYYLTAGDQQTIFDVRGNVIVNQWTSNSYAYPIAVSDTVKTTSYCCGPGGKEYTLGGVATGTTYANPSVGNSLTDGTTNGTNNFAIEYNDGAVYAYGLDWTGGVRLFATNRDTLGITFDPAANGLWLAGRLADGNYGLALYSMTGTLLKSFDTAGGRNAALGLDLSDNTLWYYAAGSIYQYSETGALLSSVAVPGLAGNNILGGEFREGSASVPEPASILTFGAGLIGFAALRGRKRRLRR